MQICVRVAAVSWAGIRNKTGLMKKTEIGSVRRVSPEYWFKLSQNIGCETVFATGIENWKMTRSNGRIMYLKIYFDLVQRLIHEPHLQFILRARTHTASRALKQLSFSRDYAFWNFKNERADAHSNDCICHLVFLPCDLMRGIISGNRSSTPASVHPMSVLWKEHLLWPLLLATSAARLANWVRNSVGHPQACAITASRSQNERFPNKSNEKWESTAMNEIIIRYNSIDLNAPTNIEPKIQTTCQALEYRQQQLYTVQVFGVQCSCSFIRSALIWEIGSVSFMLNRLQATNGKHHRRRSFFSWIISFPPFRCFCLCCPLLECWMVACVCFRYAFLASGELNGFNWTHLIDASTESVLLKGVRRTNDACEFFM